ncbi:DNA topoisomerase [Quillaja saponaria]|uniref:DNA topoisomerase n=1 Tax=Quillaja saponaria TaxID=32244 RepID=A0AAD7PR97_QUISA|nr:DNA topoisomerase [Quillaja saponaria]
MKMKPQDPVFEIEDDEFLSEVAAMEADALSNKRRKVTTVAAANSGMKSKEEVDGLYMAALKGSKSVLVSQRIVASDSRRGTVANGRVKVVSAAGGNDDAFVGGGGGGGSCFKCGKLGHWARDCMEMGGGGGYNGNSGNDATVAEKPCPCGLGACLVLTANTEKNRGRKFYKCPMKEENGACGFFEWCDNDSGANYMTSGHQNHGSNSSLPDIPCPCGAGSCLILTAKTGNNVGQQFYRCPANQERTCCPTRKWHFGSTGIT